MKTFYTTSLLLLLQCLLVQPAASNTLLGISYQDYSEQSQTRETSLAGQLGDASANLVTVYNYNDDQTLLSMLTQFKKLDAAILPRKTYESVQRKQLVALAEVQISDNTGQSSLVLVSRSDLTEDQQFLLLQGYQEILMSSNGLELLERYASKSASPSKQALAIQPIVQVSPPPENVKNQLGESNLNLTGKLGNERYASKPESPPEQAVAIQPLVVQVSSPPESVKEKLWEPHVDLTGKLGNERSLGEAELFIPVVQNYDSMLFLDLRFQQDDHSATEGNFGLGYRKIFNDAWIIGGYGFYDRRNSEHGNDFEQLTLGAEALTTSLDLRLNLYLAEDKDYLIASQKSLNQVVYSGNNLVYQTGGVAFETREKAMSGFDFEVGWLFPWFKNQEVRGYLGGYHFSESGVDDITGPRGRLAVRFADIFAWPGSLLELGGEIRHDNERDTDYYISARARIPLSLSQKTSAQQGPTGLRSRMTERIQRDPDIIIGRQHEDSSSPINNEILSDNGSQITVTHVDSQAATGDGSFESPYNSLTAASSSGNQIVLLHADSVFDGEGITLTDNQRLLGEPAGHNINTDQFGLIPLPRATEGTATPVIQNVTGSAVEVASGSEISGIMITGATTGIRGSDVGGININRNTISAVDNGILIERMTPHAQSSILSGNNIQSTNYDGIYIRNEDSTGVVSVQITNNELHNLGLSTLSGAGIVIENNGLSLIVNASGNRITNSYAEGILGFNLSGGTTLSVTAADNLVENAGSDGFSFENTSTTLNLYLKDNHVDGNINGGVFADYLIENLTGGTNFNLGATTGFPATVTNTDGGVITAEGNTRADQVTAPNIQAVGDFSIVDKNTIPAP